MQHKPQARLREQRIRVAVLYIYLLLQEDNVKEAIEVAERNGIDAEIFGRIYALVEYGK